MKNFNKECVMVFVVVLVAVGGGDGGCSRYLCAVAVS